MRVRLKQQTLVDYLAKSKLTQNHWAIKLGLSRGHLSDLANGKHPFPSPKTREKLLEGLGLQFDDLFEIETEGSSFSYASEASFQAEIADRYLIDRELGQGGMGTVYLARDVKHGRQVAIKVISPEAISGVGAEQFLKETRRTAQLEHPNILTLLDSGEAAGYPYYVMPFVRGGSLRDVLKEKVSLSIDEAVHIARSLSRALSYAHQNRVVHCDIKPENVLIGEDDHVYLADFGIARAVHAEVRAWRRKGEIDSSAGTPAYVSPEQASGELEVDPRTDVYSLGCILYEMLSGHQPFRGATAAETVAQRFVQSPPDLRDTTRHVPATIAQVVRKSMSLASEGRYQTAELFRDALHRSVETRGGLFAEQVGLVSTRMRRGIQQVLSRLWATVGGNKFMSGITQDITYAVRSLRRQPAHTAVLIGTLALGIGVNAAMFSVVNAVLLKPLPYPEPTELVALWESDQARSGRSRFTFPNFVDVRDQATTFDAVAAYFGGSSAVTGGDVPVRARAYLVSEDFFRVFGVPPLVGGTFVPQISSEEGGSNVVISHAFWQSRMGGDPEVLGRELRVDGRPATIVGVMPPGFSYPRGAAVWSPHDITPFFGPSRTAHNLRVIARLRDATSVQVSQQDMTTIAGRLSDGYPNEINEDFDIEALSLHGQLTGNSRSTLVLLFSVVTVVLLIACGNIASILLSQAAGRRKEMAMRSALGASSSRLVRQVMTESAFLGFIGGVTGLLLAVLSTSMLNRIVPPTFLHSGPINLDWRVVAFALSAGVMTGLIFGAIPAWHTIRRELAGTLRGDGSDLSGGGGKGRRLGGMFVVPQYAFSLVALVAAGLVLTSLFRLSHVDPGFDGEGLLAVDIDLPTALPSRYADGEAAVRFLSDLGARVEALPGVGAVTFDRSPPLFGRGVFNGGGRKETDSQDPNEWPYYPDWRVVGPRYFTVMGISLRRGRDFSSTDDAAGVPVVTLNETLARQMFGESDPLGNRIRLSSLDNDREQAARWLTIVGVVDDVHVRALDQDPRPAVYVPVAQHPTRAQQVDLVISTEGDPAALVSPVRDLMRVMEPGLPLSDISTFESGISDSIAAPRFRAGLLAGFGALGLLLALLGMYGVMSYSIAQRRREMAVRVALGADGKRVVKLLTGEGFKFVLAGQVLGTIGVFGVARLVEGLLFESGAWDWRVFLPVSLLLATVVVATTYIPARRAGRVQPIEALKDG